MRTQVVVASIICLMLVGQAEAMLLVSSEGTLLDTTAETEGGALLNTTVETDGGTLETTQEVSFEATADASLETLISDDLLASLDATTTDAIAPLIDISTDLVYSEVSDDPFLYMVDEPAIALLLGLGLAALIAIGRQGPSRKQVQRGKPAHTV